MLRKQASSGVIQPAAKKPRTNKAAKATKATINSGPFTPFQIPADDNSSVKYTKAELDKLHETRCRRYDDLLNCARNNQQPPSLLLPPSGKYAIPVTRICYTIRVKLELIDIFRFIQKAYTKV
ncbi:hypothetical protein BGX24_002749 [Mortierella sp. AD032]|nr:hypothetical protein BGX24_002749 [Mortierella sp. AD032]